jgi:glutamate--cysteine ligase catalytic subunit
MINGTNWSSVRLKIPTEEIGWRVELRTMEVQLTADENTALSILSHLLIRLLHENLDLNFYIPITLLMENFNRAHKINALINEKFFFRTNIYDEGLPEIEELTIG